MESLALMELMADWEEEREGEEGGEGGVIIAFDGRVRFNGWTAGMRGGAPAEQGGTRPSQIGSRNRELGGKACQGSTINAVTLAQISVTECRVQCILNMLGR